MPRTALYAAAGVAVLTAGAFVMTDDGYTVSVVMPSATNLVKGSSVQIDGAKAGTVTALEARDGKALVKVDLSDDFAPLHSGTTARISWKATLGERILDLQPGEAGNAELPEGSMIEGTVDRVELDQVLASLDGPTRAHIQSLVKNLDRSLAGHESHLQNTLTTAGPMTEALGEVLEAVGQDGPAIRSLVNRLRDMSAAVASRQADLAGGISGLSSAVGEVAGRREALSQMLAELPSTLDQANRTLGKVPGTVDAAVPLLRDLQPATAKLPAVARQLSPVLTDLRPAVAELRPTLDALDQLLGRTPGLLTGLSSVVPQVNAAGKDLSPMLAYLRPYMPELAGWLANWGSGAANYDAHGHYLRAFAQEGSTSLNHNPGVMPPGITQKKTRLPGESEGQVWADAHGSELR